MDPDLLNFRHLTVGTIFHLDAHYGNVYRKASATTAEFVRHRLNSSFIGTVLDFGTDRPVRLQPLDPETLELLGIDPLHNPFSSLYVPDPDLDLLGSPSTPNPLDLL